MKYVLILTFIGLFACERDLPTSPTVIDGIVIDENEIPIHNALVSFYGVDIKGFRGTFRTFNLEQLTDQNGAFTFSQVIPNGTDHSKIILMGVADSTGIPRLPEGFDYAYFLEDQFILISRTASYVIEDKEWYGRTLNIKIKRVKNRDN